MYKYSDDYDHIMLSLKEKYILHRILKKREVPYSFCNEQQRNIYLKHEFITIQQRQIVTSTGKVVVDDNAPKLIHPTDKAIRYFLYRKEAYFKGKLPVVVSIIALIFSILDFILVFAL